MSLVLALVFASASPFSLTSTTPRTVQDYTALDRGWRFSPDDDPAFAAPDFDDSAWEVQSRPLEVQLQRPHLRGWYRLAVDVAPETLANSAHMILANSVLVTMYVDGRLVLEQDRLHLFPAVESAVAFQTPGRHVIALRVENLEADQLRKIGFEVGFLLMAGDRASLNDFMLKSRIAEAMSVFFAGCAGMLGFLHLLLFAFGRYERGNLYFGLLALSLAAITLSNWLSGVVTTSRGALWVFDGFKVTIVFACMSGLRFYYGAFLMKKPAIYWVFVVASAVVLVTMPYMGQLPAMIFACLALLEQLRVIIVANLRRVEGAWLVGIGGACSVFTGVLSALGSLLVIDTSRWPALFWAYGFFVLLITSSIYLARRVTRNQELLDNLARAHEQLQQAQARLIQSEKMASLGQLVAGIAHEINTPVGAINSVKDTQARALQKVREELGAELESRPKLQNLLKVLGDGTSVLAAGSERVSNLVKRLRSFARLDEAEMKAVDLHQGLDDSLLLVKHELRDRISVTKEYGPLPEILCYPGQLNQVFLNLLINAAQAIEGPGEIHVRTHLENGRAHVAIRDSGTGIKPENLKKIFDPGFTTKSMKVGTGLGLAICYQIVEAHKGELRVESEVGKGSTFTVVIPVSA